MYVYIYILYYIILYYNIYIYIYIIYICPKTQKTMHEIKIFVNEHLNAFNK